VETLSRAFPNLDSVVRGAAGFPAWLAAAGLGSPDELAERSLGDAVTEHRSSWVRRVRVGPKYCYVKVYDYVRWTDRWRGALRNTLWPQHSRATREWDALLWLRSHEFAAPQPVAVLESRRFGWLRRAVLVSEEWSGRRLDHLLPTLTAADGLLLARVVVRFVAQLHHAGFRDRNLDLRNLLARRDDGGGWLVAKLDSPRYALVRTAATGDRLARADWARLLPQFAAFGIDRASLHP
jgi:Lipopolysaccharide kinase (Kdo/WaaP) family